MRAAPEVETELTGNAGLHAHRPRAARHGQAWALPFLRPDMLQAGSFAGLLPFPLLSHSFVQPLLIIEGPSHAQGQLDWGVTLVGLVERGRNMRRL